MKIGFIGAGNMASGLDKHWAAKGHELFFSHSRDQDKLKKTAASFGGTANIKTAAEAAKFADILVWTTPYGAAPEATKGCSRCEWQSPMECRQSIKIRLQRFVGGYHGVKLAIGARFVAALPPFAEVLQRGKLPNPAPQPLYAPTALRPGMWSCR